MLINYSLCGTITVPDGSVITGPRTVTLPTGETMQIQEVFEHLDEEEDLTERQAAEFGLTIESSFMTEFEQIMTDDREILSTLAVVDTFADALNNNVCVSLIYDGKPKIIEVHAVGKSTKDGALVVRAFQVDGESSRPLPSWALMRVEKMTDIELTTLPSEAPRPGYQPGDKQMSEIFHEA
jgi:hypothetical protein